GKGADKIGLDKSCRAVDRAIDMGLGGKMIDGARLVGGKERLDTGRIADIRLREMIARTVADGAQVLERARVSQLVDDEDIFLVLPDQIPGQRGANETGPSRYENSHCVSLNAKSRIWSFNSGKVLSFSERIAFSGETGHLMPSAGSFQKMPQSCSGL